MMVIINYILNKKFPLLENSKNELITNNKNTAKFENSDIFHSELNNQKFSFKKENINNSILNSKKYSVNPIKEEQAIEKKIINEMNENQIILDNCENFNNNYKVSNLSDLLYKLNFNTDIEEIIDTLNSTLQEQNKLIFDKNDFNIRLKKHELDKFFKIKSVDPEFSLNLKYSLLCKNKKFNQ